ncbi:unnamed protein product [Durusdinium trenchii]|uniref:Uncharacterized protein n=2 Tax=Durusdinium trenchii TaxID=1381693 RepID=A0ABP0I323_9DINO
MRFLLSSVLGTFGLVAGIRKELLGVEEQKAVEGGLFSTCCVMDGYNHPMWEDEALMKEASNVMLTLIDTGAYFFDQSGTRKGWNRGRYYQDCHYALKLTRHYGCDTRVQLTKKKIVLSYKYLKRAEKRLNNFYKEYQFKKTSRWNPFGNASCPTGMVPAQETDRCSIDMERLIWVVRTWKEKVSKDKRLAEINVHSNNPLFQDEVERLKKDIAKIKEQYSEMYFHMQEAAKMHRF